MEVIHYKRLLFQKLISRPFILKKLLTLKSHDKKVKIRTPDIT